MASSRGVFPSIPFSRPASWSVPIPLGWAEGGGACDLGRSPWHDQTDQTPETDQMARAAREELAAADAYRSILRRCRSRYHTKTEEAEAHQSRPITAPETPEHGDDDQASGNQ